METPLNLEWVNQVARELAPIYKFMDHDWGDLGRPPTAAEIAGEIKNLWRSLLLEDMEVASWGLHVSMDEDESPVVAYRKEIIFEYASGEPFSV